VNLQEAPNTTGSHSSPWGVKKGREGLRINRLKSEDLPKFHDCLMLSGIEA